MADTQGLQLLAPPRDARIVLVSKRRAGVAGRLLATARYLGSRGCRAAGVRCRARVGTSGSSSTPTPPRWRNRAGARRRAPGYGGADTTARQRRSQLGPASRSLEGGSNVLSRDGGPLAHAGRGRAADRPLRRAICGGGTPPQLVAGMRCLRSLYRNVGLRPEQALDDPRRSRAHCS